MIARGRGVLCADRVLVEDFERVGETLARAHGVLQMVAALNGTDPQDFAVEAAAQLVREAEYRVAEIKEALTADGSIITADENVERRRAAVATEEEKPKNAAAPKRRAVRK